MGFGSVREIVALRGALEEAIPTTGETSQTKGTYTGKCKQGHSCGPINMEADKTFPPCPSCKDAVTWTKS
jgi:hypothetical protein